MGVPFGGSAHVTVTRRGKETLRAQGGRCGVHEPLPAGVSVGGGCQRGAARLGKRLDRTPRHADRDYREVDRIGRAGRAAHPRGSGPAQSLRVADAVQLHQVGSAGTAHRLTGQEDHRVADFQVAALGQDAVHLRQHLVGGGHEFIEKLGAPYYAWHDRDIAPEGKTLAETNKNLDAVAKVLKEEQKRTGIKLLWGTANLFSHPRFVHGASTSCNADVFAFAAAQVKKALEVTHELGGEGYTFWGGREGYMTLLNTDMKREQEHLAKFLHLAVAHKKKIGFQGQFYIEPKPKEPTKHQYDSDAAACLNFLREFDLLPHFKLNIEANHATLAGHTMQH